MRKVGKKIFRNKQDIKDAITGTFGSIHKIAQRLEMKDTQAVYAYLKKYDLYDYLEKEAKLVVDVCENKMLKMALSDEYDGNIQFKALCKVLEAKGGPEWKPQAQIQLTQNNLIAYDEMKKEMLDPQAHINQILAIEPPKEKKRKR